MTFQLAETGEVIGEPKHFRQWKTLPERIFAESTRHAVLKCSPFELPATTGITAWPLGMTVNFDATVRH